MEFDNTKLPSLCHIYFLWIFVSYPRMTCFVLSMKPAVHTGEVSLEGLLQET